MKNPVSPGDRGLHELIPTPQTSSAQTAKVCLSRTGLRARLLQGSGLGIYRAHGAGLLQGTRGRASAGLRAGLLIRTASLILPGLWCYLAAGQHFSPPP